MPSFEFDAFEGSANFIKKMEVARFEVSGTSSHLEGSVGSAEPWINLKLRNQTYFESNDAGSNVESITTSVMRTSSTTTMKKTKSSGQNVHIPYWWGGVWCGVVGWKRGGFLVGEEYLYS
ncbi:squamosa promoter-binding-like protein 12 [Forsythia ovata]|uniref:Squamosa promoter-binding-like protein 12 n=1 Tax=Forsythia ovata TaxID=205694 RepID=A0ABD1TMM8_9LAMI